ncbi:PTS sugar transporter subunit IIA, partial [Klebsiella pneumoniae]
KACVLPENPASYRVVRTKSYLFNKAVVIMLCARSGNEHITMIGELAEIFSDQQKLHRLLNADDSKAIQAVID